MPIDLNFPDGMHMVSWIKSTLAADDNPAATLLNPDIYVIGSEFQMQEVALVFRITICCTNEKPNERLTIR
ncbi:hypothetical protein O6H91_Y420100 [Diphasiastrum complanatum]|nr:hypothetical protein O6H91_Y420100 [Diphasiastrum complanatum]